MRSNTLTRVSNNPGAVQDPPIGCAPSDMIFSRDKN